MNYRGKKKRGRAGQASMTSDYKKAVVTLKAGDKIELL
jgi:large subunit ribosomal protein L23